MASSMVGQLAGLSKGSKPGLGKGTGTDVDWHWFLPFARDSTDETNRDVRNMNCVTGRIESLTTIPNKRIKSAGIL